MRYDGTASDCSMGPPEASTGVARFASEEGRQELDVAERSEVAGGDDDMTLNRLTVQSASFSGPLPAPPILAQYNHVVPGLAREIVDQWKGETRHRQETVTSMRQTDHEAMVRYYDAEKRGQRFAILAIFGLLALATVAIVLDRPAVGVTGLLTGGAAAVWAMRRRSGGPDAADPLQLDAEGDDDRGGSNAPEPLGPLR
jgi:uncharacterized membrane protein